MVKKREQTSNKENELYILPSLNEDMRSFAEKFKIDMMEHVVSSIDFAIKNDISIVEVFQFKDSPFVVTITEKEFESNLVNISRYYTKKQIFELCLRVDKLLKKLKNKTNEKETPKTDKPDNTDK